MAILSAVLRDEPKPVDQVVADMPRELGRIISRCLRKDPAKRFQHVADLKVALEEIKEESDSGKLRIAEAATSSRLRWPWVVAAGVAIAMLAGGLAGYVINHRDAGGSARKALSPVPLTSYPGDQTEPKHLLPTGTRLRSRGMADTEDNATTFM